jgi:hypothetical protein
MPQRFARLLAVLALLLSPALAAAGEDYERWYTVELAGQRSGYMRSAQKTENGRITTSTQMHISMGRGDHPMTVEMSGEFVETTSAKPLTMRMVQKLGTVPKTVDYTFGEKEVAIATVEGDQNSASTRPLPEGKWLTPAAASEYIRQRLGAGAEKIVYRTVDPMSGKPDPDTVTLAAIEHTTTEAMGKTVPAVRCSSTTSAMPGVSLTEYLDDQGVSIRSQISLGMIKMNVVAADRETALAPTHGAAPEMMVRTFIRPDRPIPDPRKTRRAVYLLSVPDGTFPQLPTTGFQRVEPAGDAAVRVTLGGEPAPAPEEDPKNPAFTASSSMLRCEDPDIKRLTAEALREKGPAKPARAEALRAFVHRYITTKDLDVGFASASEVARTRRGDCSEHGALLAAMLRADGIPSRVACGIIYADQFAGEHGIFGYHMWAQALLEKDGKPTWVDLDATLPTHLFDATHIAFAVTPLAEGEETTSLAAMIPLLGRVAVKVESVE